MPNAQYAQQGWLRKAQFVDEEAPQAEWRLVHRIADSAYPRVYQQVQKTLGQIMTVSAWSAFLRQLEKNDPTITLTSAAFDPLADGLHDHVWPTLWQTYVRAGETVARSAGQRGLLQKAKKPKPSHLRTDLVFNETNPFAQRWAEQESAQLVTRIVSETQDSIRALVGEAFRVGRHPYQIARDLRGLKGFGITKPHAIALLKKRDRWIADGLQAAEIQRLVQKQYNFYLRYRAESVARTEVLKASNAGQMAAWQQGKQEGLIDADLVKEWIYTPDRKVCPICEKLDGEQRSLDQAFSGGVMEPPVHPMCRCAIGLVPPRAERRVSPEASDAQTLAQDSSAYPVANAQGMDSISRYSRPDGTLTPERQALHDAIVREHLRSATRVDKPDTAYVLGGGPASGKSTLRKTLDLPDGVLNIDVDEIRNRLPEYREMSTRRLDNAARFTHEESSKLSKRLARDANPHYNIVYDGTGDGSLTNLRNKVAGYRARGQNVVGHYVTLDTDEAWRRAKKRAERPPYRHVPEAYLRETHMAISEMLPNAMGEGLFDEVTLWDNNGASLVKIATSDKTGKIVIHDNAAWTRFLKKAQPNEITMKTKHIALTTETLDRILFEVMDGATSARPDTPREAEMRRTLEDQVAEIRRQGGIVDIPSEIP